jgi:hypothetical protein
MTKTSICITQQLSPDDLLIALVCLEEVNITDHPAKQRDLQRRFCRALRRAAPDFYGELVRLGKFTDRAPHRETQEVVS